MIIELFGLPGSGKTTLARGLEASGEAQRIRIGSRTELLARNVRFALRNPLLFLRLLSYLIRYGRRHLYTKFTNLFLGHNAKFQKARAAAGTVVLDQGHFQNLLSLFDRPMSEEVLARYAAVLPKPDELWICASEETERARRLAARGYGGGNEARSPEAALANFKTAERILRSMPGLIVRSVES